MSNTTNILKLACHKIRSKSSDHEKLRYAGTSLKLGASLDFRVEGNCGEFSGPREWETASHSIRQAAFTFFPKSLATSSVCVFEWVENLADQFFSPVGEKGN